MDSRTIEYLLSIISKNKRVKQQEFDTINQFGDLYNIINHYVPQNKTYEEIMENPESRIQFLTHSIHVALNNGNMDESTINVVLQMFDNLSDYFFNESELQDIEIPQTIRQNMFNSNDLKKDILIPNPSSIMFLTTLLKENKRTYEEEFLDRDLSHKIKTGLHTGITEVLSIDKKDISHMLGVNNSVHSLFEFYRKTRINEIMLGFFSYLGVKTEDDLTKDVFKEFNRNFKLMFGLNYNSKNYKKLINLKYADIDKELKEGTITKKQAEALKAAYDLAPKSKTLDFYCERKTYDLLVKECEKNASFIYDYVRKEIIAKKCETPDGRNKILEKLAVQELKNIDEDQRKQIDIINDLAISNQEKSKLKKEVKKQTLKSKKMALDKHASYIDKILDFNIHTNEQEIRDLLDKYIEMFGNKLKTDQSFQKKFMNKFGYSYPLIDYYEVLKKNISFYNFSLLKNLNSIIVDYDYLATSGNSEEENNKRPKVDTFLVSYNASKLIGISDKVNDSIKKKDKELNVQALSEETDLTDVYIASLKSLVAFPKDDYYFKYGFTRKEKQIQDDKIIEEESTKNDLITMMGFITPESEKQRLESSDRTVLTPFYHFHNFNTNITCNYYQYRTDYTRFGVEYPMDMLSAEDSSKKKKYVLSIANRGPGGLNVYIKLYKEYQYMVENGHSENKEYEEFLINSISHKIYGYKKIKETKIKMLEYKKSKCGRRRNELAKYDALIEKEQKSLKKFRLYYDDVKQYFENRGELFDSGSIKKKRK